MARRIRYKVTVRGLISPWKQLRHYNFDVNMTRLIVEIAGFLVVAVGHDLSRSCKF